MSVGMSDQEMTSYIKETFCVDSTYEAKQLFDAAELPPSWQSVCAVLGLSATRGLELQNALLRAKRVASGNGSRTGKRTLPDDLPTDATGRPLVYGQSIKNGICRDAEGTAPKGANGKAKAAKPLFSFGDMMQKGRVNDMMQQGRVNVPVGNEKAGEALTRQGGSKVPWDHNAVGSPCRGITYCL